MAILFSHLPPVCEAMDMKPARGGWELVRNAMANFRIISSQAAWHIASNRAYKSTCTLLKDKERLSKVCSKHSLQTSRAGCRGILGWGSGAGGGRLCIWILNHVNGISSLASPQDVAVFPQPTEVYLNTMVKVFCCSVVSNFKCFQAFQLDCKCLKLQGSESVPSFHY